VSCNSHCCQDFHRAVERIGRTSYEIVERTVAKSTRAGVVQPRPVAVNCCVTVAPHSISDQSATHPAVRLRLDRWRHAGSRRPARLPVS